MKYDDIFTFENLFNAHRAARKCKRNKKDVITFENELSTNLWDLYEQLHNHTYTISGYHKFYIYEPKKREIQALLYKDRVVQHALCDLYLYPLITSKLIYDNGACQKGKGTDFALDRLTLFFHKYFKEYQTNSGYILKADIKHYFPSINHDVLKDMMSVIDDEDISDLIFKIIDSFNYNEDIGIPMGNQTSQLFALYYLNPLDRLIKEQLRIKYYVRYMDDMIILCRDKDELKSYLEKMKVIVEDKLKLEFNQKTQIFPIKNGVDFLGFHLYMTETGKVIKKLRNSSKKRFKNRMKKMNKQFNNGEIEMSDIQKVLPGFNGHMKRGDTWNFRKSVMSMLVYNNRGAMENKNISALTVQAKQLALEISAVRTNIGESYLLNNLYKSGTEVYINLSEANEMTYNEDKTFYISQARKSVKETMVFLLSLKESGIIDKKLYSELNNKSKNILLSIRKLEL